MSNPAAGWYPDPGNPNFQRWWDSVQWGPQVRPAFQMPPPPPPAQSVTQYAPYPYSPAVAQPVSGGTTTRLRKTNGIGFAGAVVGLGSLIINPFCAASVVGIVLCIIGLVKDERMRNAGLPVAGRGWMIAGLVLGVASTIIYALVLANYVGHVFSPTGPSVPLGPTSNA